MTFYSIYFGSARVLLPHAELHHLSTSINGRRRYRLDQSTPSLAAIVRRSSTQCRRPRTPPRKLPRSSHESSHARLALYPPRTSHLALYHHPFIHTPTPDNSGVKRIWLQIYPSNFEITIKRYSPVIPFT